MKNFFLFLFLISIGQAAFSQSKSTGTIKGGIFDASGKQPLPDATVSLFSTTDSSGAGFAIAAKDGLFEIKNIPHGNYYLNISFTGFGYFTKDVSITREKNSIDLGQVFLVADSNMLEGVVVEAAPILIKKDTVEFRAGAFKTKPNATVEDLLKKLPGVEVDKDGKVTAQGEEITKIYVDGKEFFSNDPKLATKNLTAELVESIQVFDDMSDQAKFTKMDDGSQQRTINIKLKKDRRKGYFGRAIVGGGTSDRYSTNIAANTFNNKRQISLIGGLNNVNRLGFTSNDIISGMGGMGGISGGGRGGRPRGGNGISGTPNGNTESWNIGLNFRDEIGTKIKLSGNYFVNNNSTLISSNSYRQNFFPNDSISNSREDSYNKNSSFNQRFFVRFEYAIDSMNSILLTPTLNLQHSEAISYDSVDTRAQGKSTPEFKAIGGKSLRSNARDGWNFGNDLLFRHRFAKAGRTFTVGWKTDLNQSNSDGLNTSPYSFYNPDGSVRRFQDRRQQNDQDTRAFNNTISTSLTEMFGTNKILEVNYAYTNNQNQSDRRTYDYNTVTDKFDSINKPLTNYFENDFIASRIGTNFRVKKEKYDYQVGGAVQLASLKNLSHRALTGKDSTMQQRYTNFFPSASFNYNLRTRKSIRFRYRGNTRAPSITQLQDVLDVSNQLRYRIGNPDLQQEFNNNFNLSYNTINLKNFLYLNASINASATSNKIVNSIDSIGNSILLTKPVNVDGAYNVSASNTVGIPLKKVASGKRSPMNLNLSTSLRYNRDVSVLYGERNFNFTTQVHQRVNFNYNIQDKLDLSSGVNFTYNDATYTVNKELSNRYFSHNYSLDVTYTIKKKYTLSSDFDYFVNSGRSDGFNQSVPLWNASAAMWLFKKKNAEIRISIYDILNQNKSISRDIGENYIEDNFTEVLKRFAMVSFMYNLNKFGGKAGRGNDNQRGNSPGSRGGGRSRNF